MKKFIHNEIFGNLDSRDPRPSPGRKFRQKCESDHQNLLKSWKIEKSRKQPKTSGFIDFSTFKINFRSADAANHVNRDPGGILGVTRRAYIPKIYKLEE